MGSVEITIDGAAELGTRLINHAETVRRETADAVKGLGEDAELIFAAHALHRSGRMARGIASHSASSPTRTTVVVTAEARNPESGYDYVGVTRFGHRVARIYPRKAKALRTPWGPRASVAGFHPRSDWRDDAMPDVREMARLTSVRLGQRIGVLA